MWKLVLTISAVGSAGLSVARNHPTPTPDEAGMQDAASLARLIYPESLNEAVVDYTITKVVTPAYHADPGLRTLEAAHPGIIDAMIAAMRPEFARGRREALPRLWTDTAAVYAAGLTPGELHQAVAFHRSPAGLRLALAERNAVAQASRAVGSVIDPVASLDDADPQVVRARSTFEATATGRKLIALQLRIAAIVTAWNEARTPEADARVGSAMSKAASRFLGSASNPARPTASASPRVRGRKPAE